MKPAGSPRPRNQGVGAGRAEECGHGFAAPAIAIEAFGPERGNDGGVRRAGIDDGKAVRPLARR